MALKSETEVIADCEALLRETQDLRTEAERYEKLHGMYLLPKLPKDLAREEAVYLLSPDVMFEAYKTVSKVMGFDTEIEAVPQERTAAGTVSTAIQNKVDLIEKGAAVWLYRIDPDRATDGRVWHRQLVEPCAITVLEMGGIDSPDPKQRFPWKWFDVDFEGCGWLEVNEIPTIFSRRYFEYVFKTQELYSGRKDGPGEGKALRYDGREWKWQDPKASDDVGYYREGVMYNSDTGRYAKTEKVFLDDGQNIYHVCLNSEAKNEPRFNIGSAGIGRSSRRTGKLVGVYENPFGRVSAFLTGSNVTPSRFVQDRWLPHLLPLITTSQQENDIASIRATAARNRAAPRDYWDPNPEVMKALLTAYNGDLSRVPATEWADGKTPIGYGTLQPRPVEIDPDINNLDQRLQERKARYSANTALQDREVLKASTAAAILAGYDQDAADLSSLVGRHATLLRQLIESWEHSMKWLQKKYPKYANFEFQAIGREASLHGGTKTRSGEDLPLTGKSFDVGHKWYVSIRQRNPGQAQAQFAAAMEGFEPLPDGRPNIGVYDDLFKAKGVSDTRERIATLAKEAGVYDPELRQYLLDFVKAATQYKLQAESGINVGLLPGFADKPNGNGNGASALPPGKGPNTGTQTNSPVTVPAEGASGPEVIAG